MSAESYKNILGTLVLEDARRLVVRGSEFTTFARDLYSDGFTPVDLNEIPGFLEALSGIREEVASGKIDRNEVLDAALGYHYGNETKRREILDQQVETNELGDKRNQAVRSLAYLAEGIAALVEESDQNDVVQQIGMSLARGGGEAAAISPRLTRVSAKRMLKELGQMFGIERYERQGVLPEALVDMYSQALTENTRFGNLAQHFEEVCRQLGQKVPFDLAILQDSQALKRMKELAKVDSVSLSAKDVEKMIGDMPNTVEAESIETLQQTVIFRCKEADFDGNMVAVERKAVATFVDEYNCLNGDEGEAYRVSSNLPPSMWKKLVETYPEYKAEFSQIRFEKESEWTDSAKKLSGRIIRKSNSSYNKKLETNPDGSIKNRVDGRPEFNAIPVGAPILFSELAGNVRSTVGHEDESLKPWLDKDPLELGVDGLPVSTCVGGFTQSRGGRELYLNRYSHFKEMMLRKAGIEDINTIEAMDPFYRIQDFDADGNPTDFGLMPDGSEARVGAPGGPASSGELVDQVLGDTRLGKYVDWAYSYSIYTREIFKHHPTSVEQQLQSLLKPYLLERYWHQFGVHNLVSRLLARNIFGSMTDRMMGSKHALLQALGGKPRQMYHRDRYNHETNKNSLKLASLKDLPEYQKDELKFMVGEHKNWWLDETQSLTIGWVVANVRKGYMSMDDAKEIINHLAEVQMTKQNTDNGGTTEMMIRSNRQMQLAEVMGQNCKRRTDLKDMNLRDYLASLGEDVSKLEPEETMGNMGMCLAAEHEGVEMIEMSKILHDALKHRKKYEGMAEELAVSGTELGVAAIQALDETVESWVRAKPGNEVEEVTYFMYMDAFAALLKTFGLVKGDVQFSPDLRSEFVKNLREKTGISSGKLGFLSNEFSGMRGSELEILKTAIAAATEMVLFADLRVSQDWSGYEGIGPGARVDVLTLDGDDSIDRELIQLLRGGGVQALRRGDAPNRYELCLRNANSVYEYDYDELDVGNKPVKFKLGNELRRELNGNGNGKLLMPRFRTGGLAETYSHHPQVFGADSIEGVRIKLGKLLISAIKDAGALTNYEQTLLMSWIEEYNKYEGKGESGGAGRFDVADYIMVENWK